MSKYYFVQFGAVYGEGSYGSSSYSCTDANDPACNTSTGGSVGGGTDGSGGGSLADTGVMLVGFATLACLIIFAAVIVRFVRRKPQLAPQEAGIGAGDNPPSPSVNDYKP